MQKRVTTHARRVRRGFGFTTRDVWTVTILRSTSSTVFFKWRIASLTRQVRWNGPSVDSWKNIRFSVDLCSRGFSCNSVTILQHTSKFTGKFIILRGCQATSSPGKSRVNRLHLIVTPDWFCERPGGVAAKNLYFTLVDIIIAGQAMADFSQLKALLSGNIILRSENEKAYQQEVDETWNAAIRARKPAAFVRVATVADVANTIKFCVQNEVNTFTF